MEKFLNKVDKMFTQIAQPQSSWGQDVQADGADEGWGRAVGGGIERHGGRGGRHPVALQTQEEFSGFVHIDCVPLHALHYDRLRESETEEEVMKNLWKKIQDEEARWKEEGGKERGKTEDMGKRQKRKREGKGEIE